ncbi:MAG TPA: UTP--glucose-1-phosphate uridylyltransferase GalU [Acidimicrobiales bacterium]|nr:UTP--glucose-1-phosphate uridylyltransferase GalU [Acidimicrobiales bacterium]
MTTKVRKAVIPAAGLGTRFLPATKAQPKEMLPLIDTPVIQYVVEEAARVGIRDVLVVTGRGKASLEDHFDQAVELEQHLERADKQEELAEIRRIPEIARLHYVRQGEPRGLGHAVSAARQYVGNEPFVVMLGDDIMDPDVGVLDAMLAAFARHGRSVVALKTVEPTEISSYGCARVEPLDDDLVRIQEIVEKPSPEAAPSNLAVMGRYVFTPAIFDALDRVGPGRGGEIQLTDAIALLLLEEEVHGYPFEHGRWDTGNKLDYLRATMELALRRPELAPAFRKVLVELANKLDEE